jgi:lipid A 3-O-deacylase
MRSFELMTMSLPPLTQFENALPHYGVRSIARESAGGARGLAWLAGGLRSAVVAMAATLILGATGLQGGEDFAREVLVTRERPGDKRWEVALETAGLFGVRNPNNYVIAPQLLSLAWQPFPQWQIGPVRIRCQVLTSFLGEAILHGPESYFLGGALRVRLIFPLGSSPWALYADGGGGIGAVDSDDTPFGQGEDFAFCLLASGEVRFAISSSWSVWAGLLWQHLSNAGISEPRRRNTALDSIGPVAGVSYAF